MENKRNSSINSKKAQKQFPKLETMKSKPNPSYHQQTQTAHKLMLIPKLEVAESKPTMSEPRNTLLIQKLEVTEDEPDFANARQTLAVPKLGIPKLEIMETKPSFSIPKKEVIETKPNCSAANQTLQVPQVETIESSDAPTPLLPDINRQSQIFHCKECIAKFTNAKSLAGHMGSHAKNRIFQARLQEKLRVLKRAKLEREAAEMEKATEEIANEREEVGENEETQSDLGSSEVLITSSYRVAEDGVLVIDEDDDDDI